MFDVKDSDFFDVEEEDFDTILAPDISVAQLDLPNLL